MNLKRLQKNLYRRKLLSRLPRNGIVAEVGVFRGDFATRIESSLTPVELHLIDSYEFADYNPPAFCGEHIKSQDELDEIYKNLIQKFSRNGRGVYTYTSRLPGNTEVFETTSLVGGKTNITIYRGDSLNVLEVFDDEYFDAIYLDSCHNYYHIFQELRLVWQKVKLGGYLCGDGYGSRIWNDVTLAVRDFASEKQVNFDTIGSQFIIKRRNS